MQRYYFDTREGDSRFIDSDGQVLETAEAARDIAMAMLPQLIVSAPAAGRERDLEVEVRDAAGVVVLIARLALSLQWQGADQGRGVTVRTI